MSNLPSDGLKSSPPSIPPVIIEAPPPRISGLAIAALICGVLGLFIPLVGIVALVLGIVVLAKTGVGGKGLAIAGIVTGVLGIVVSSCLVVPFLAGLLLPALGKARESARLVKSGTQLRQIGMAMQQYAIENGDQLPELGANLQERLANSITPALWQSPNSDADSSTPSYLYVGGGSNSLDSEVVLMFENPELGSRKINILFADIHVEEMSEAEARELIAKQKLVYTPEGVKWTLPPAKE